MEFSQIRNFPDLAETLNFAEAARLSAVSQSAPLARYSGSRRQVRRRLVESHVCRQQPANGADIGRNSLTRCWRPTCGHYLNRRAPLVVAPIRAKAVPATKQKTAP